MRGGFIGARPGRTRVGSEWAFYAGRDDNDDGIGGGVSGGDTSRAGPMPPPAPGRLHYALRVLHPLRASGRRRRAGWRRVRHGRPRRQGRQVRPRTMFPVKSSPTACPAGRPAMRRSGSADLGPMPSPPRAARCTCAATRGLRRRPALQLRRSSSAKWRGVAVQPCAPRLVHFAGPRTCRRLFVLLLVSFHGALAAL